MNERMLSRLIVTPIGFSYASLLPPLLTPQHNSIDGTAIIDTGATKTAVRIDILIALGLVPIGIDFVNTASQMNVATYQFIMKLSFPDDIVFDNIRVNSLPVNQPVECLLGMDILMKCHLEYNGPNHECIVTVNQ